MSSLFDIGKSGLQSYRQALSVTGQNIANINTDGYKRREASLEEVVSSKGGIQSLPSSTGLGVRVDSIRRSFDEFLLNKARSSTAHAESVDYFVNTAGQIEDILIPGEANLGNSIGRFFNSMQEIATAPASLAPRTVAIERGNELTESFNRLARQMEDLRGGIITQSTQHADQLNGLLSELANLNVQIASSGSRLASNSLLDARDGVIDKISNYAEITVTLADSGSARLSLGNSGRGPILVDGSTVSKIGVLENSQDMNFVINPGVAGVLTSQMTNGSLHGLAEAYKQVAYLERQIDDLAFQMIQQMNHIHQQGIDLEGNKGKALFSNNGVNLSANQTNQGDVLASYTIQDFKQISLDEVSFTYFSSDDKWVARNQFGQLLGEGRETINLPGIEIRFAGSAKNLDQFFLKPSLGASKNITFQIDRLEEFAAASPYLVTADGENLSSAKVDIQKNAEAPIADFPRINEIIPNEISAVSAAQFIAKGPVAIIPKEISAIDLFSLKQQASLEYLVTEEELADLDQMSFSVTSTDDQGNVTTANYLASLDINDYVNKETAWTSGAEIADLLNKGVIQLVNGADNSSASLKDIGGFASGDGGKITIALAEDEFAGETALRLGDGSTRSGFTTGKIDIASSINIFTREGRHIAGNELSLEKQQQYLTVENGFNANAEYRTDYLNLSGEEGYAGLTLQQNTSNGDLLFSVSGSETEQQIKVNFLDGIDGDLHSPNGKMAISSTASYSVTVNGKTASVSLAKIADKSAEGIARALTGKLRDNAPISTLAAAGTLTDLSAISDGDSFQFDFENQRYTVTWSNDELVVNGGEEDRLRAYFDQDLRLNIASNDGTLSRAVITLPTNLEVAGNEDAARKFKIIDGNTAPTTGLSDDDLPIADQFTAVDFNVTVEGDIIKATAESGSITIAVDGTSTAGSRLTLQDLPNEELIIVLRGDGARTLTASFDAMPPLDQPVSENVTIKVIDKETKKVEFIDSVTGTSLATRFLDQDQVASAVGLRARIFGEIENEDRFYIAENLDGKGDSRHISQLADLQLRNGNQGGFQETFNSMVAKLGATIQTGKLNQESANALKQASLEAESSYTGVNLDTEASRLIEQQQSYQASARILQTAREIFDTLFNSL